VSIVSPFFSFFFFLLAGLYRMVKIGVKLNDD
jgi:hypothetical protein